MMFSRSNFMDTTGSEVPACWVCRAQRCCQLAEIRFFWALLSKHRRRRSGARGALLSPAWCLCWCGRHAMRRSSAASTSCWRRCARCCRWTSCRCTAASCRCPRRCPSASGSAWLVGLAIPAADVSSSRPTVVCFQHWCALAARNCSGGPARSQPHRTHGCPCACAC